LNSLIASSAARSDDNAPALSKQFKTDYYNEIISDSVKTVSILHSMFNYADNVIKSHILMAAEISESNRCIGLNPKTCQFARDVGLDCDIPVHTSTN